MKCALWLAGRVDGSRGNHANYQPSQRLLGEDDEKTQGAGSQRDKYLMDHYGPELTRQNAKCRHVTGATLLESDSH